jgi:hypothetical protein
MSFDTSKVHIPIVILTMMHQLSTVLMLHNYKADTTVLQQCSIATIVNMVLKNCPKMAYEAPCTTLTLRKEIISLNSIR